MLFFFMAVDINCSRPSRVTHSSSSVTSPLFRPSDNNNIVGLRSVMKLGRGSSSIIFMTCFFPRRVVSAFVIPAPSSTVTTNMGSRRVGGGDLAIGRRISHGSSPSIAGPTTPPTGGGRNTLFLHGRGSVGKYATSAASSSMRLRSAIAETSTEDASVNEEDDDDESSSMTTTETMVVELPTNEDNDDELLKLRHSAAHVMAMAVQRIYPEARTTIGPWIENGFYYDFYFPPETTTPATDDDDGGGPPPPPGSSGGRRLNESDLRGIKKEMDRIISANYPILRREVTRDEARALIMEKREPFKLELLDSITSGEGDDYITIYSIGDEWWDLCAGPHVDSTGRLNKKATALESVAGSYWRGDENRQSLQRIYGTAWKDVSQLKAYKNRMEEAKKRDHRVLGKKLDLFSIQEDAGGGLVFWHPKGSTIRRKIEDFWKERHIEQEYDFVYSPHIANLNLWKTSGHYDFYREGMFDQMEVENEVYQIKPMNCPFHCLMFKDGVRSYRELPFRWAELGTVYRYERSGTLHGLFRVRGFTQDDAHIFCLPEQLQDEIVGVLQLTKSILSRFGFEKYELMISTRPKESVGSDKIWEDATAALVGALDELGWAYGIDEGGGAFYGPKIDLKIKDAIGRTWQCSTIQCDFNLPERFDLEYVTAEGTRERPVMVHRAIFGSIERFFGILIENTAGDFPFWLAPVQMKLLPVTDAAYDYCKKVASKANRLGLRVEVDRGSERLAKQIRNAEQSRIPIMAVVGAKEIEEGTLAVRSRKLGDLGSFTIDDLLAELKRCDDTAEEMMMLGKTTETVETESTSSV